MELNFRGRSFLPVSHIKHTLPIEYYYLIYYGGHPVLSQIYPSCPSLISFHNAGDVVVVGGIMADKQLMPTDRATSQSRRSVGENSVYIIYDKSISPSKIAHNLMCLSSSSRGCFPCSVPFRSHFRWQSMSNSTIILLLL